MWRRYSKLFKASGAKFAGPVAEHCDNFSNWDSKVNKYNTVNYGPKRDLVGELEKAIKGEGLKFVTTFHHSWEWGWYNLWSGYIVSPPSNPSVIIIL
ncbi:MAG: alpha-L-fucosidase [Rikenellaceae bacterium]